MAKLISRDLLGNEIIHDETETEVIRRIKSGTITLSLEIVMGQSHSQTHKDSSLVMVPNLMRTPNPKSLTKNWEFDLASKILDNYGITIPTTAQ